MGADASLGRLEGDLLVTGAMEKGKQKDGKKNRVAVKGVILRRKVEVWVGESAGVVDNRRG